MKREDAVSHINVVASTDRATIYDGVPWTMKGESSRASWCPQRSKPAAPYPQPASDADVVPFHRTTPITYLRRGERWAEAERTEGKWNNSDMDTWVNEDGMRMNASDKRSPSTSLFKAVYTTLEPDTTTPHTPYSYSYLVYRKPFSDQRVPYVCHPNQWKFYATYKVSELSMICDFCFFIPHSIEQAVNACVCVCVYKCFKCVFQD